MIIPPPAWLKAPEQPILLPGEIHLWRTNLCDKSKLDDCAALLPADELLRARRFVFQDDQDSFIISHAALRVTLARYLCADPQSLAFVTGPNGKPRLVQQFTDIRFNLSHSHGIALIAVTRGREVGVDVELVNEDIVFDDIAEHYFDPREVWELRTAPADERVSRFFDVWTRKEATLKACGAGLTGKSSRADGFGARNFAPASGYSGAVASEGDDWQIACWDWTL